MSDKMVNLFNHHPAPLRLCKPEFTDLPVAKPPNSGIPGEKPWLGPQLIKCYVYHQRPEMSMPADWSHLSSLLISLFWAPTLCRLVGLCLIHQTQGFLFVLPCCFFMFQGINSATNTFPLTSFVKNLFGLKHFSLDSHVSLDKQCPWDT